MTIAGPSAARELRPGAGSAVPGAEALIAEARRRQRRRWRRRGVLGASLVLLAAAVTGGIGLSGRPAGAPAGGARLGPPGPAAPMPSRIVVWTAWGKIEVLSSRTGRLIRTLAANVAVTQGLPTLAVSAAGVVYFDDARGPGDFVLSVPLAGGPVTTVADGFGPALSPDGRLLAYLTYTDYGTRRRTREELVVRDLPAGTQKTWAFTSPGSFITNLSWSPGGRFLAFAGLTYPGNGTAPVRTAQVLDTYSGGTLDGARRIPFGQRVAWAGFLTSHTGVGVTVGQYGDIQTSGGLLEVGVGSGRVLRRLTSLPPHGLAAGNAVDGTENTITVDRTGRYLLIAGNGTNTGEIFEWTFGMPRPVAIAIGAYAAVWAA